MCGVKTRLLGGLSIAGCVLAVGPAAALAAPNAGRGGGGPARPPPSHPVGPTDIWAVVNEDGTLARGVGVKRASLASECTAVGIPGCYVVVTGRDVTYCS